MTVLLLICPARTATQDEKILPFETIVRYGNDGPRENIQGVVFKNRDWRKLWNRVHSEVFIKPPRPFVDFSTRMVIVVSFEYLPDPSWNMEISEVAMTEDGLRISIEKTQRGGRFCPPVPDILVHPLHIVETERVEKRFMKSAEFQIVQQVVDCEPKSDRGNT